MLSNDCYTVIWGANKAGVCLRNRYAESEKEGKLWIRSRLLLLMSILVSLNVIEA